MQARVARALALSPVLFLAGLLTACGDDHDTPRTEVPASAISSPAGDGEVVIAETTQGRLDGVGVGVGNIWDGEYSLADGTRRNGPSAGLWIGGAGAVRVGAGSVVSIGAAHWEVVAVEQAPGGRGAVRLRRSPGP